jgi:hypothetical protein
MKLIAEKLTEVILKESSKSSEDKKVKDFEQLLADMKKTGLIKQPNYNLPLVDTIGKTYYSSFNKRK